MSLKQTSACPKCGSPIYMDEQELAQGKISKARFSCTCPRPTAGTDETTPSGGNVLLS